MRHRYMSIREALVDLYEKNRSHELLAKTLGEIVEVVEHPDRYNLNPLEIRVLSRQRLAFYLKRADATASRQEVRRGGSLARRPRAVASRDSKRILADVAQDSTRGRQAGSGTQDAGRTLRLRRFERQVGVRDFGEGEQATGSAEFLPRLERLQRSQPANSLIARTLAFKLFDAGEFKRTKNAPTVGFRS